MNNRRQTIWLVSMLSLMVILSAYYLFTDKVAPVQNATDGMQKNDAQKDSTQASGAGGQDVQITELGGSTGSMKDAGTGAKDAAPDSAGAKDGRPDATAAGEGKTPAKTDGKSNDAANQGAISATDEAVLKEVTNLTGVRYFDQLQRLGQEKRDQKKEEMTAIVADTKNHTQDEASAAMEELAKLEDAGDRITSLQEKLLQDYDNAVVTEDATNFKIVVQTAKLNKKQAVQIIDQAAKELKVTPDRLSVQFVP